LVGSRGFQASAAQTDCSDHLLLDGVAVRGAMPLTLTARRVGESATEPIDDDDVRLHSVAGSAPVDHGPRTDPGGGLRSA